MSRALVSPLLSALIVAVTVASGAMAAEGPDLILYNGRVFTAAPAQPWAEAIAIKGDRIVGAGTSSAIRATASATTGQRNLGGRLVIPGINDAHLHLFIQPKGTQLHLDSFDPGWEEVEAALRTSAAGAPKGSLIFVDVGARVFDDARVSGAALDRVAPDHVPILRGITGHFYILGSAARRRIGLRADQPDPVGGRFERSPVTGELTGRALEYAAFDVHRRIADLTTDEEALVATRDFLASAERFGVTTVQNMSMPVPPERLARLYEAAPTQIRQRIMRFQVTMPRGLPPTLPPPSRRESPLVGISGTKWILDGTPIERTAYMSEPYADSPGTSGWMDFTKHEMQLQLRASVSAGDALIAHIIGDATTATFLAAMESTGGANTWRHRRVRIEHGCGLTPELIAHAKELGVVVVIDPSHFDFASVLRARWGARSVHRLEPLKSLIDAGIPVALASDGQLNPYVNILLASTHPFRPEEAISREQAVSAYTVGSAYAEFAEQDKGSLQPGMLADLAVLSKDIFEVPADQLPATESVLTVVGGKVVYDALR